MSLHAVFTDAETENLVLQVDDPFAIRDLIKESRTLDHAEFNVAVRWSFENVQALRDAGYDVPEREHEWPGPYKPFAHQLKMIAHRLRHQRCFDLSEQGAAKTAPSLWAADKLMKEGKIRKALILCPLSTVESVWQNEIFNVLMHRTCAVVHGTQDKRRKALSANVDFYIMNHDAVRLTFLRKLLRQKQDIDLMIIDEIGMFRDGGTEKFDALEKIVKAKPHARVWGLTGTPCPNSPEDAWSQCRIINPDGVPEHRGTWKVMTMLKETAFKWVARRGHRELVFKAMQPAIRFLKKDCLDLPPMMPPINLTARLTAEQAEAFKAMQAFQLAHIGDTAITAVHAADELGKLRQILCGVIKNTETGEYIDLGFAPRLAVLREAIEGAEAKALVIVPFKGIINRLAEEVAKFTTVGVLNGDVSVPKRNAIIAAFKNTDEPHVLLCHPRVMAHGLNLTEADRTIFYAPIFSNDEFSQVVERFNRMGQKNPMTIVRISTHFIEREIYAVVDKRGLDQQAILSLYRQAIAA